MGAVIISVYSIDDGGTANGGSDRSLTQEFAAQITKKRVWHNAQTPQDVTGKGEVAADDVIGVIKYINTGKPASVPMDGRAGVPYCDTPGDGIIAADGVVKINDFINARPVAQTGSIVNSAASSGSLADSRILSAELVDLLAIDLVDQPKRRSVMNL